MTALSIIFLALLVIWFTLGLVPLPSVLGSMRDFPKREPLIFVLVALALLAFTVGAHMLGW